MNIINKRFYYVCFKKVNIKRIATKLKFKIDKEYVGEIKKTNSFFIYMGGYMENSKSDMEYLIILFIHY